MVADSGGLGPGGETGNEKRPRRLKLRSCLECFKLKLMWPCLCLLYFYQTPGIRVRIVVLLTKYRIVAIFVLLIVSITTSLVVPHNLIIRAKLGSPHLLKEELKRSAGEAGPIAD